MVFATIYQEQSITRAADALHVSQPAVSASLSRLREKFNDPLFVRSRNGVSPTSLAHNLIGPVREALQALDLTFKEAERFDPATSQRTLTVSMGDLAEVLFLPPLVARLHALESPMTVHNVMAPDHEIHDRLACGELDFAVEYFHINESHLNRQLLLSDDFVCVVRDDHPVLTRDWHLDTYLGMKHLLISSRARGEGLVDTALHLQNRTRHNSVRVQHCLVAHQMLRRSEACLTVPKAFVTHCLGREGFAVLPLPFDMPRLELWLYWHANSERSAAHRWVRDMIVDSMKQ
nr:LysR family transcriptional regulator [Parahaliea mediterranea]